jgi:zinc transport system ATP-binding protein
MGKAQPIIAIHNLWFSYNRQPVLRAVELEVRQGEFLALIGPNGGGKTTLLKLMLGLLQADRGTIRVFDKPPLEAAQRIGYVPQDIHVNKSFPIAVMDVVLMGRLRSSEKRFRHSKNDKQAARKVLEQMGMWEYRKRRIGDLSGGQLQRALIARALVAAPDILFLDEPTASVDTKGQTELYDLLVELNETVTIVVVSHDLLALSSAVKSVACVNQSVHYHGAAEITGDMLETAYQCPVDLIAHGLPHRVLKEHEEP